MRNEDKNGEERRWGILPLEIVRLFKLSKYQIHLHKINLEFGLVCAWFCVLLFVCVCICMKYVCILIMLLSCLNTSLPSFEQQDFSASLIMINYQANRSIVSKSNQEVITYIKKILLPKLFVFKSLKDFIVEY